MIGSAGRMGGVVPALLALALLGGCSSSELPVYTGQTTAPAAKPARMLSGDAVRALVSGNTLVGVGEGGHWDRYFATGGALSAYTFPKGRPATQKQWDYLRGDWTIDKDHLCIAWTGGAKRCFTLSGDAGQLYAWDARSGAWAFNAVVQTGNVLKF